MSGETGPDCEIREGQCSIPTLRLRTELFATVRLLFIL